MKIYSKKYTKETKFDFYGDVLTPFVKRFPSFSWLIENGIFDYAWWYMFTHPHIFVREVWLKVVYTYQRAVRGYDKPATYGVCHHLAEHIPNLLRELKAWGNSYPPIPAHPSHIMPDTQDSDGLKRWHAILDEIILGFESYLALDDCPVWDEFHEEWNRRYPNVPEHYFEDIEGSDNVEWKYTEGHDELMAEMRVWERDQEWRKEKMKLFHRGFILFHLHFMHLWD